MLKVFHGGIQLGRKKGVFVNGSWLNGLLNMLENQVKALKLDDAPIALSVLPLWYENK